MPSTSWCHWRWQHHWPSCQPCCEIPESIQSFRGLPFIIQKLPPNITKLANMIRANWAMHNLPCEGGDPLQWHCRSIEFPTAIEFAMRWELAEVRHTCQILTSKKVSWGPRITWSWKKKLVRLRTRCKHQLLDELVRLAFFFSFTTALVTAFFEGRFLNRTSRKFNKHDIVKSCTTKGNSWRLATTKWPFSALKLSWAS